MCLQKQKNASWKCVTPTESELWQKGWTVLSESSSTVYNEVISHIAGPLPFLCADSMEALLLASHRAHKGSQTLLSDTNM